MECCSLLFSIAPAQTYVIRCASFGCAQIRCAFNMQHLTRYTTTTILSREAFCCTEQ